MYHLAELVARCLIAEVMSHLLILPASESTLLGSFSIARKEM